jgi:hypothetical protein
MPDKAFGKAAMKKTQVYGGIKVLVMAVRVSMTIHAASTNCENIESVCVMLCEVADERVFRRNISWKHSNYSSQRSEHVLPLLTFGSKLSPLTQKVPCRA